MNFSVKILLERGYKFLVDLKRRLAACQNDLPAVRNEIRQSFDLLADFIGIAFFEGLEYRIAERTGAIAT